MRLIDADALYDTISDHVTTVSVCPTVDWARGKAAMKEICLEDIKNAPTVSGWISVSDRLPSEGDYRECHETWDGAVIWTNGYDIGLGCYHNFTRNWADIYDGYIDDVTHWMPLPEPPKEDEDDAGK